MCVNIIWKDVCFQSKCVVCGEDFEKFWSDDNDEWRFADCQNNLDGNYVHSKCLPSATTVRFDSAEKAKIPVNAWHLTE